MFVGGRLGEVTMVGNRLVVAICQGMRLIGEVGDRSPGGGALYPVRLSPVYELHMAQSPDGRVAHVAMPLLMLSSVESLDLPEGSIILHVDQMSQQDQRFMRAAFDHGQKQVEQMRLAALGIVPAKMRDGVR